MYKSPIEVLTRQVRMEHEENIYKAVLEQGVVVDKQELIRALQYDRDQYDNGYRDGYEEGYRIGRNAVLIELKNMLKNAEEL